MDMTDWTDKELDACTRVWQIASLEYRNRNSDLAQVYDGLLRQARIEARRRQNGPGYNGKAGH